MPDRSDELFLPSGDLCQSRFDEPAYRVLLQSLHHARQTGWDSIRTPHLFLGLLSAPDAAIRDWCRRLNVEPAELGSRFEAFFRTEWPDAPPMRLHREFISDNALRALRDACNRSGPRLLVPYDLLLSVLADPGSTVAECFERIGFAPQRLLELAILTGSRHRHR